MIFPRLSTMATDFLLLVKTGGMPELTSALTVRVCPGFRTAFAGVRAMSGDFTVTSQVRVIPSTLTEIRVVPCLCAVTSPFSSTDATLFFREEKVGVRPDETRTFNWKVCLRYRFTFVSFSVTFGFFTVTLQVCLLPSALAVMVVFPVFCASIFPVSSMVATRFF